MPSVKPASVRSFSRQVLSMMLSHTFGEHMNLTRRTQRFGWSMKPFVSD
jgi:hypothetical protein